VADTIYTTMQLIGKLGGSIVLTFPIENLCPFKVSHYQATLATSAVVLLITNSLAITLGHDKDPHIAVEDDSLYKNLDLENTKSRSIATLNCQRSEACVLGMVLTVQFIGWIGNIAFTFWYTTWLGLDTSLAGTSLSFPTAMMAMQTLLGLFFSFFLPKLNRRFPIAWVWILSELIYLGSLCSCRWLGPENPIATFVVLSISIGPCIVVHKTNAQLVARLVTSEEDNIGWVAGLLANTMNLAQIVIGGISGVFVVCNIPANGSTVPCPQIGKVLYFWIGIFGLIIDLFVLAIDTSYLEGRLFSIGTKKRRKSAQKSPSRMTLSYLRQK